MQMIEDSFYQNFEQVFRGDESLIKQRLSQYDEFLQFAKEYGSSNKVLDLGCGRGEWLDLASTKGFVTSGVEINLRFIEKCKANNHEVISDDALSALKTMQESSFALISSFHMIEHVSSEYFTNLVFEAFRVLEPGGLLILETPNIENIGVATSSFFLDPTHLRPVPIDFIQFAAKEAGFISTCVFRLQENPELIFNENLHSLEEVLYGASPDIALIAMKDKSQIELQAFEPLTKKHQGISGIQLAKRFDSQISEMKQKLEENISPKVNQSLDTQFKEINREIIAIKFELARAQSMSSEIEKLTHFTNVEISKLHEIIRAEQERSQQISNRLESLLNSKSWIITAPLRRLRALTAKIKRKFSNFKNNKNEIQIGIPETKKYALDAQGEKILQNLM